MDKTIGDVRCDPPGGAGGDGGDGRDGRAGGNGGPGLYCVRCGGEGREGLEVVVAVVGPGLPALGLHSRSQGVSEGNSDSSHTSRYLAPAGLVSSRLGDQRVAQVHGIDVGQATLLEEGQGSVRVKHCQGSEVLLSQRSS